MRLRRKNSAPAALIMRSGNGSGCAMNSQCQDAIAHSFDVLVHT